jgi:hypothetical protein
MHGLLHGLTVALRSLRTQPWFSSMIVGMLALGIAGSTAIFSIFYGRFLQPLRFCGIEPAHRTG